MSAGGLRVYRAKGTAKLRHLCALRFRDITHPEDLPNNPEKLQQLITGEIREFSFEKHYLRKAGGSVWVMLTVAQDITDLKRAQDNLLEIARGVSAATGVLFFTPWWPTSQSPWVRITHLSPK